MHIGSIVLCGYHLPQSVCDPLRDLESVHTANLSRHTLTHTHTYTLEECLSHFWLVGFLGIESLEAFGACMHACVANLNCQCVFAVLSVPC